MRPQKFHPQKVKYDNVKRGFQKLFTSVKTGASDEGSRREQAKLYYELINSIKSEDIPSFIENFYGPGKTVLFDIKKYGFESQFNEILNKYQINPNVQNPETGDTLLIFAVGRGDMKIIDKFLKYKGVDPNISNKYGQTAIFFAPTLEIAKKLLDAGANLDRRDVNGITPLINFVINSRYSLGINEKMIEIVDFLIHKDSATLVDNRGWNALFYAIDKDVDELIDKLTESGINVNWQDKTGKTVLMLAVEKNNLNLVKKLIENGASLTNVDNSGMMAIDYARKNSSKKIVDYLVGQTRETIEVLADAQSVLIGSLTEEEIPDSWENL